MLRYSSTSLLRANAMRRLQALNIRVQNVRAISWLSAGRERCVGMQRLPFDFRDNLKKLERNNFATCGFTLRCI